MDKVELQEIIEACEKADSDYIRLYRPLLGYEENLDLNRGIDDSLEETVNLLERNVGIELPGDLLQLYLIANGGKYFDIKLYYLTNDRKDPNGMYYKNTDKKLREEYNIPNNMFIIGEISEYEYLLIGIDDEGYYYYCAWDKEEKKKSIEFSYLTEVLMHEIDYYTQAFSYEESED